ncbi:MAG: tail fiber protein [Campylobacterales bacterium]|nr:tail fiber protein [Campylobacterales bacterium]
MWLTAAQFCPQDTVEANGQQLSIQQYPALSAIYGITYGGDARTYFNVPDMRGKMPVGTGLVPGTSYTVQRGDKVGQETMTLTQASLPTHTHTATFAPTPITVNIPVSSNIKNNTNVPSTTNKYLAASSANSSGATMWANTNTNPVNLAGVSSSGGVGGGSVSVAATGATAPTAVVTIPPQLGVRFCIVTIGTWPENPN